MKQKIKKIVIITLILLMLIAPTVSSKRLSTEKKEEINKKIEQKENNIEEYTQFEIIPLPNSKGILPAFALVKCRWKIVDEGEGERTIHFWVFGWGEHEIIWDTLDDHDGDGTWDLGPGTPWHYKWFALLLPLRHYDDWCAWDGYPGRAKVKVNYEIDEKEHTKTFEEPI